MKKVKQEYPRLIDIMEKANLDSNNDYQYEIGKSILDTLDKEGYRFYKEKTISDSKLWIMLSIPFWLLHIAVLSIFCKVTKTKLNNKSKIGKLTSSWGKKILSL